VDSFKYRVGARYAMAPHMKNTRTLLLIDNHDQHHDVFRDSIANAIDGPFEGERATTLAEGIERLKNERIWAIFVNLSLPDSRGIKTLDWLMLAAGDIPILVLAGVGDRGLALEALRRGAKDYLLEGQLDRESFVRAIRNMAEREAAAEALFVEKERAHVTLNSIGDAVLSTDNQGNVTYLNPVAEEITGWTVAQALGRPVEDVLVILDSTTGKFCQNPLRIAIERNKTVGLTPNCVLRRRDGTEFSIDDSAAPIHDQQGTATGAVIVFHDVSVARAVAVEMAHMAQHDTLTNLPNRSLFRDRVHQAIILATRNGTRMSVLFLDLDRFKEVNDSMGHAFGDRVLQAVVKRLLGCVRASDTVSRLGGDEFVILLSEIKQTGDAGVKAGQILTAVNEPFEIDSHRVHISASIGVATYPGGSADAETLIKTADMAMYEAKEQGRNSYRFQTVTGN
jgi:diguanylate cyclase (GGDEF)-like protein/PAS domain S-box-containing protein